MRCSCGALLKAIDAYIAGADDDLQEELADAGFIDPEDTVKHASGLEDLTAAALVAETDYVLDSLKDAVDLEAYVQDIWPDVKKDNPTAKKLFDIFWDDFTGYMKPLASKYIAATDAGLTVTTLSKRTSAWMKSWSRELADLMVLDGNTAIENILARGVENGESIAKVTRAIIDSGIRNEYYRARRVSLTETLRAHSVASQEAMMQSPAVEEKEWRHIGAYRTKPRQNHVNMDGQRVKKGEAFMLEGADGITYYPEYPRDSILPPGESVSCHCISQPIVSAEVLGLPVEERRRLQEAAIAEMDADWEQMQIEGV